MERTYTSQMFPQNPIPALPSETPPAAEKVASGIGNFFAVPLTVLIAVVGVLFLLFALQPIFSILVALIVFPIMIPLAVFLFVWFDLRDPSMNWKKL